MPIAKIEDVFGNYIDLAIRERKISLGCGFPVKPIYGANGWIYLDEATAHKLIEELQHGIEIIKEAEERNRRFLNGESD